MTDILMKQALSLDDMFADLLGRAADNQTGWPQLSREYTRLALRAQSGCRSSLVAMERADRAARPSADASAE